MSVFEGTPGEVRLTTTPPEIRIRVQLTKPWDGKTPIAPVNAIEHALRDCGWFLFGRRTSPGYSVTLRPVVVVEEGALSWLECRVTVIPKNEPHKDRLARMLTKAADRAREALGRSGAIVEGLVPKKEPANA